ncbi:MAG: cation transporter [Clostridia bacterium]|nr:cation transporter [Clostridia bacterium]
MKKTYKVEVDCANCAAKMEDAIKKIDGIGDATLNFMTQKLIVEFEDGVEINAVMQAAYKACKKVESDCVIYM